jgi:hypothetical protein
VVDDRPEYANRERFPEADRITCGRFEEVLADYPIDAGTHIVCVTRGHRHDETSLKLVVDSPAAYVGMIGSKRRVKAVLQHLVEDGASAEHVARVRTPIGLDIGAETPEEIAVAIMAEIVMERRGGGGASMRETGKVKRGVAPDERALEDAGNDGAGDSSGRRARVGLALPDRCTALQLVGDRVAVWDADGKRRRELSARRRHRPG